MLVASRIRVTGIVQGVGFRPFVWRLARDLGLSGWVRNDTEGVEIAAEGDAERVQALIRRLKHEAPPLARIDAVAESAAPPLGGHGFAIVESGGGAVLSTAIGVDVGVCADCLDELFAPAGRRWRHAFITCTHCGPRYTVTHRLPYDRPQTSLAAFPLCAACASEYADPADRRFHAETSCCPDCGPRLYLRKLGAGEAAPSGETNGDPLAASLALLRAGAILAIKGLGGFHLACDARNAAAVARLRARKDREAKPFALMVASDASVGQHAVMDDGERDLLLARERPVVLLRRHAGNDAMLAGVAPGLDTLGVMLPTTPIHYLLFHEAAARPEGCDWLKQPQALALVMTSANPGGEPIVRDDDEALQRLAGIADYLLGHDRAVVARCDDSVVRQVAGGPHFIRRSRGYAPQALRLRSGGPSVLAFGAHLKNTVCLTRGADAFVSPHIGDLDTAASCGFLDETVKRLLDLLAVTPDVIAHDRHPDYYSSRAAVQFAQAHGLQSISVQHHHAHIAGVCAEHGIDGPVLGLALDGVGLGDDDTAWGGELLHLDAGSCRRVGRLRPLALPGGDRAAREPWRMAAAALHALGRGSEIAQRFDLPAAATVVAMLERNLNCPKTSSMGRVFDAAAGLLGLCLEQGYEAHAAMLLEQAAARHIGQCGWTHAGTNDWRMDDQDGLLQLDLLPLLARLGDTSGHDAAAGAAYFHEQLVAALAAWVGQAAHTLGTSRIAWSGGCFFNQLLSSGLLDRLRQRGLTVYRPQTVSPGDAGISLGQAWVALQLQRNS